VGWSTGYRHPPGEWRRGKRKVGEDLGEIWHAWLGIPLSLSFPKISNAGHAWDLPRVVLISITKIGGLEC
jgi:hypothetical protein